MRAGRDRHLLDRAKVERALAVLREEREANPVTQLQRKSYFWLRLFYWGFWVSSVGFIGALTIIFRNSSGTGILFGILGLAGATCLLGLLVTIAANYSLFCQAWRQRRLARATHIWAQTKPQSLSGRSMRVIRIVGIMVVILPGVLMLVFLTGMFLAAGPFGALFGAALILATVFYSVIHTTHKRLGLLADADVLERRLRQSGTDGARESPDAVEVSSEDFQSLAELEDMQIERRRAEAVQMSHRAERPGYSLLKSTVFAAELDALDAETQLRVEACADELASRPAAAVTEEGTEAGIQERLVPETTIRLRYALNPGAQRIELLSLGGRKGPAPVEREAGSA
jgi:hypothetical protein